MFILLFNNDLLNAVPSYKILSSPVKEKVVKSEGAVLLVSVPIPVFNSLIKPEVVVSQYKSKSD